MTKQKTVGSPYLLEHALTRWYILVGSNNIPDNRENFENYLELRFAPLDNVQKLTDKLFQILRKTYISTYLSETRNTFGNNTVQTSGIAQDIKNRFEF